jgi:hypothetical protein
VSEFEEGALAEIDQKQLIFSIPQFLFRKQKIKIKSVCRGVELTMMKASNSSNNDSNGEVVGILVCMECISPFNGGWQG